MKKDLFDSLNSKIPKFDPSLECLTSSSKKAIVTTISIPASTLGLFIPSKDSHQRLGQQAYAFFDLHKVKDPEAKAWADKLWESDGEETKILISRVIDYNN